MNNETCCGDNATEEITVTELSLKELELEFLLDKEVKSSDRMKICKTCPELKALNRCSQCGCFMDIKVRIYKSKCPLGKW